MLLRPPALTRPTNQPPLLLVVVVVIITNPMMVSIAHRVGETCKETRWAAVWRLGCRLLREQMGGGSPSAVEPLHHSGTQQATEGAVSTAVLAAWLVDAEAWLQALLSPAGGLWPVKPVCLHYESRRTVLPCSPPRSS
ncbi:unnamed protein product [Gadus morhua 'NCC']